MNSKDPALIALNLIEFVLFYTAMNNMLSRRSSFRALIGTIAAVLPVYYFVSSALPFGGIVRFVFGVVFIFIPVAVCYTDPLLKRIALYAGGWVMIMITETIIGMAFNAEMQTNHPHFFYNSYLLILAILLTVYVLVVNSFQQKYKDLLRPMDRLAMAFFLFGQIVMFFGLLRLVWTNLFFHEKVDTPTQLVLFSLILCVLSDILLIWMLIRSARASRTEMENVMLTRQIEEEKKYYTSLNAQYETIRRMRHDISNHIYTVEALLSEQKIEEAEEYTERLSEENRKLTLSKFCEHPVVDSFLTSRAAELTDSGIGVHVEASVPRTLRIDSTELITALGNLLDNAEEACRGLEDPEISLDIAISENVLIIHTRNPIPAQGEHKERIPGLKRGIGTLILKELAEKYNGHYELKVFSGAYIASLYLVVPQQ